MSHTLRSELRAVEREALRLHQAHEVPTRTEYVDEVQSSMVGTARAVLRINGRLDRMLLEHRHLYRRMRKRRRRAA